MMRILRLVWDDIKYGENIDLYITVAIAILLTIFSILWPDQLSSRIESLTLTILALFAISLLVNRRKMEAIQRQNEIAMAEVLQKFGQENKLAGVYSDSNDEDFVRHIRNLLKNANEVKIYSIAISVLWDPQAFDLLKRAIEARRTRATIIMADPNSPQIIQRLTEEEECYYPAPKGADQIDSIFKNLKRLEESIGDANILSVKKFYHYPTFTLIIIDKDIFFYPYGYKTIGSVAPVLHLRDTDSRQSRYFREQFDLLVKSYSHVGGSK
jgi:hypothetical protein